MNFGICRWLQLRDGGDHVGGRPPGGHPGGQVGVGAGHPALQLLHAPGPGPGPPLPPRPRLCPGGLWSGRGPGGARPLLHDCQVGARLGDWQVGHSHLHREPALHGVLLHLHGLHLIRLQLAAGILPHGLHPPPLDHSLAPAGTR